MPHVTFIHGIANKPPATVLLKSWQGALADGGLSLAASGVTSSMVYWADVMYPEPKVHAGGHESVAENTETDPSDENLEWTEGLSQREAEMVESLRQRLGVDVPPPKGDDTFIASPERPIEGAQSENGFEALPIPWFIKRRLMKVFLRDVHHYLFNHEHSPRAGETYKVRDHIRNLFVQALTDDAAQNAGGKLVVVGHSMGTVIGFDCLKYVADCPSVDALLTLGSPLGLSEVQDNFDPPHRRASAFPDNAIRNDWSNFFDRLDPVALDAQLANDYLNGGNSVITDVRVKNGGVWRHNIVSYLRQPNFAKTLKHALEI